MTLNRLIHPDSEHAMPRWIRSTALADILGADLTALADDPLYRNLDRLHPDRAAIESDLVERERRLFQLDPTIYLYDLTSTYFEGQAVPESQGQAGLFPRPSPYPKIPPRHPLRRAVACCRTGARQPCLNAEPCRRSRRCAAACSA